VAAPDQVAGAVAAAERALGDARRALADLEAAAARGRRLAGEERAARAAADRHAKVAIDLQANRFPRFLLERYRERLATGASARLAQLTRGAYRFSGKEPDPLAIVDRDRGERVRGAGTLSGGERFLASLALALGLADVAAAAGGRMECLFLDEGFSTLDAESLEQALAGVERLAGDGRLIGVITHLPGVAERLGAEIRVTKGAGGVSRISGAAADAPADDAEAPAEAQPELLASSAARSG
jgi:exonuclease SbcC